MSHEMEAKRAVWRSRAIQHLKVSFTTSEVFAAVGAFIKALDSSGCELIEADVIRTAVQSIGLREAEKTAEVVLKDIKGFALADPWCGNLEFEESLHTFDAVSDRVVGFLHWLEVKEEEKTAQHLEPIKMLICDRFLRRIEQIEKCVKRHPWLRIEKDTISRLCLEEDTFPAAITA